MKSLNALERYASLIFMSACKEIIGTRSILIIVAVSTLSVNTSALAEKATCVEATFTQVKKSKAQVMSPRTGSDALVEFDFVNSILYGPSQADVYQYKNVDIDLYKRIYLNSILMFNNDRTSMTRVYLGNNSSKMTTYDCEYKRYKR